MDARRDLARPPGPPSIAIAHTSHADAVVVATRLVAVVLSSLRLELDRHTFGANLPSVDALVTACHLRAILSSPSIGAHARQERAVLVKRLADLVQELGISAFALASAIVWAVDDGAVQTTKLRVAHAHTVDTLAVARALIGALRVGTVGTGVSLVADAGRSLVVTESVSGAVSWALKLRAIGRPEARLAHALARGVVALAVARAVVRTQDLLTGLASEPGAAVAHRFLAVATAVALVLALGLRAVLASVVFVAQALATVALAMARALVRAHLDRTIGPTPTTIALAGSVVTMAITKTVIKANAERAINARPPMVALAQASRLVTLAMVEAVQRARMSTAVISTPVVGTCALSRLSITNTVAGAIVGAHKLRAVLSSETTIAGAFMRGGVTITLPGAGFGARVHAAVKTEVTAVTRAVAIQACAVSTA